MHRALLVLAATIATYAQVATVAITGTIYTPTGGTATGGTITATLAATCTAGGEYVSAGPVESVIDGTGAVSLSLVPTASCDAGGNSYRVVVRAKRFGVPQRESVETWVIPASPSSTTITAVRSMTIPSPSASVSWSILTAIPASVSALGSTVAANLINAVPATGAAALPTFRAAVAADQMISKDKLSNARCT